MWTEREHAITAAVEQKVLPTIQEAEATYREVNALITMTDKNATQEDVRLNFFNCCEVIYRGGTVSDWAASMGLDLDQDESLPF